MTDDVLTAQHAFDTAELRADTDRLDALLADDFLSIGEQGYVLDKRQWIARHVDFRFISVDTSEIDVRRYDRTAIVRSVQHTRATWLGTPMALTVRVSHVWIQQADGWKLAAVQFSSLAAG
ncbi:nuclear transport factor 2 family protein [Actinoplanes sp. ATCC 53533]|uniref:nuclear transport factor 2 family protein n=1 Tax=Actinoplanes sp. ATCC 53533 TaxID=1288362 RepID=UPI000F7B6A01|nr:nuclear transport factor 2 family protein [Actinoplanes sp. ATCC 53533]RSM57694.1 nuclear transport factor 2 family protein [Actinoplanes sp. ATCC 53533]